MKKEREKKTSLTGWDPLVDPSFGVSSTISPLSLRRRGGMWLASIVQALGSQAARARQGRSVRQLAHSLQHLERKWTNQIHSASIRPELDKKSVCKSERKIGKKTVHFFHFFFFKSHSLRLVHWKHGRWERLKKASQKWQKRSSYILYDCVCVCVCTGNLCTRLSSFKMSLSLSLSLPLSLNRLPFVFLFHLFLKNELEAFLAREQ